MKIAQVAPRFHPAVGGVETQVELLAEELTRRGHEVIVVTTDSLSELDIPTLFSPLRRKEFRLPERESYKGFQIYRYPPFFRFYGFLLTKPFEVLRRGGFDLIHGHCYYASTSLNAAIQARRLGIPFVLTDHGAILDRQNILPEWALSELYNHTLGRALGRLSDSIISVSRRNYDLLRGLGINQGKLTHIPNGIKIENLRVSPNKDGEPRSGLLYVGRLARDKGLNTLLDAFVLLKRSFPDLRLSLVGPDYGAQRGLQRMVKDSSLEGFVIFRGAIDRENLHEIYGSSRVLIQPSNLEGFSIVLIEAMSAGLPVVASDTQGMKELINEGENGLLFRPGSFREMAYKIGLLLRDETLRRTVVENGYKTAEKFTVDSMAERIESLYQTLVEAR